MKKYKTKKCKICSKHKRDVRRRTDPYQEDVHGLRVYKNLCTLCFLKLCDEV